MSTPLKVDVIKDQYCLAFKYDTWWLCYEKVEWIGMIQAFVAVLAILAAWFFIKRQLRHTSLEAGRPRLVQKRDLGRAGRTQIGQLKRLSKRAVAAFEEERESTYFTQEFDEQEWRNVLAKITAIDLTAYGDAIAGHVALRAKTRGEEALNQLLSIQNSIVILKVNRPQSSWAIAAVEEALRGATEAEQAFDILVRLSEEELLSIKAQLA